MGINDRNKGIKYVLAAYIFWGFFPIYWNLFGKIPALQVLAHRILWSFLFAAGLILFRQGTKSIKPVLASGRDIMLLIGSATAVSINWGIYIWATNNQHIIESSMGYFINPLISILLGSILLKEKIRPLEKASILFVIFGIGYMIFQYGKIPFVSLGLAITFAFYGLFRKTVRADALTSLVIETAILVPFALVYLGTVEITGQGILTMGQPLLIGLVISTGVITAVPLIWFAEGAQRLPLKTIGFLQYFNPTIQLLVGVLVFREVFSSMYWVSFGFVWIAIAIYLISLTGLEKEIARGRAFVQAQWSRQR